MERNGDDGRSCRDDSEMSSLGEVKRPLSDHLRSTTQRDPGEEPMELNLKARDRISVLTQVKEGVLSAAAGAARIGVTRRRFRRLRRKFGAEGDAAAARGLRGRRSNRALPPEFQAWALRVARDPPCRDFGRRRSPSTWSEASPCGRVRTRFGVG